MRSEAGEAEALTHESDLQTYSMMHIAQWLTDKSDLQALQYDAMARCAREKIKHTAYQTHSIRE